MTKSQVRSTSDTQRVSFDSYNDQANEELQVTNADEPDEEDEYQLLIREETFKHNQHSTSTSSMRPSDLQTTSNMTHNGLLHRLKSLISYDSQSVHQYGAPRTKNIPDDLSTSDEFVFRSNRVEPDWTGAWPTDNGKGADYYNTTSHLNERSLYEISSSSGQHLKFTNNRNHRMPLFNYNKIQQPRSICRSILFILILLLLLVLSVIILVKLLNLVHENEQSGSGINIDHDLDEAQRRQYELEQSTRWLVSSPKCHIPVLEPWHKSIEGYVWYKGPMNCSSVIENYLKEPLEDDKSVSFLKKTLTFVRSNRLYFVKEAIESLRLFGARPACCYKNITRSSDNDYDLEYAEICQPIIEDGIRIDFPLVQVTCQAFNYTNVHAFNVRDTDEELALRRVAASKLDNDNYYNILMVGMDTISRLNGQRQLNRTMNLLADLYETLEFVGYNKVGENTFPNLVPLLTGLSPEQLTKVQCWQPTNYTEESDRGDDFLDNCKYLWNFYQQFGYMTYFSEDWPSASTFNYLKPGFKHEPTTYYGRPLTLARKPLLFPKFKSSGCASCHLDQPIVKVDLENLKHFLEDRKDMPYFAFHWSNCPQHDDLNGASEVDGIVEKFFADIHNITQNDRTFVIFFSDHGYRWNNFVSTRIGHYEASLPMLTIAPPRRFIEQQPKLYERLKRHQSALLTPFDLFKTLIDVRNLGLKKNKVAKKATAPESAISTTSLASSIKTKRNILVSTSSSLMGEDPATTSYPTASTTIRQITIQDGLSYKQSFNVLSMLDEHNSTALDRSCQEAGIPDNYCVCHQFQEVATDTLDVLGAAYYLVYVYFEGKLRNHVHLCHQLELEAIHKAELYNMEPIKVAKSKSGRRRRQLDVSAGSSSTATTVMTTTGSPALEAVEVNRHHLLPNREYNIMFSTKPGGGLFREVVRYYGEQMSKCEAEVERAKKIVDDNWASFDEKRNSVIRMNSVCEFSVHSDSVSRLNLYGDTSICVKSNIELVKICYCRK